MARIREGMVFTAMDSDELFKRTAQYQIQYLSARDAERLALESETRGPPAASVVYSLRHDEDHHPRSQWSAWTQRGGDRDIGQLDFDGDEDAEDDEADRSRLAQLPREFTLSPRPFNVTTEYGSDDVGGEGGRGMRHGLQFARDEARRAVPNRIGALPFESGRSDLSDDGNSTWVQSTGTTRGWATFDEVTRGYYDMRRPGATFDEVTRGHYDMRRPAGEREESVSRQLVEAREASQIATQEAVRAVGGELMSPLVHFHIERPKNKCTIRFDPPVSGRFLLLKMWCPHYEKRGNIDIQGVTAKGFAGPRFVPAVEYC
jgi:hypothetical protein